MLHLNKQPPEPPAAPKTSGQGPPEELSAVGTFKSSAAGLLISESLATFTSTISGEPVEQALGAVQRLLGSLPDTPQTSPTDPIPFDKCGWNTGVTFSFKGPLLNILESYSRLGPRYTAENPLVEFRLVEVCSQFKSYGLCNCVQGYSNHPPMDFFPRIKSALSEPQFELMGNLGHYFGQLLAQALSTNALCGCMDDRELAVKILQGSPAIKFFRLHYREFGPFFGSTESLISPIRRRCQNSLQKSTRTIPSRCSMQSVTPSRTRRSTF